MKIIPEQFENHCICHCQGECQETMEWWSLAANLWEWHRLSEKVNGAESAKGKPVKRRNGDMVRWDRRPLHVAAIDSACSPKLLLVWVCWENKGGGDGREAWGCCCGWDCLANTVNVRVNSNPLKMGHVQRTWPLLKCLLRCLLI